MPISISRRQFVSAGAPVAAVARDENPWIGSLRIVLRKGHLGPTAWPRSRRATWVLYLRDEPHRAMRLMLSGEDLWRVDTA